MLPNNNRYTNVKGLYGFKKHGFMRSLTINISTFSKLTLFENVYTFNYIYIYIAISKKVVHQKHKTLNSKRAREDG